MNYEQERKVNSSPGKLEKLHIPDVILDKVQNTIERYRMLSAGIPIPVAFSGGKDSATTIFILNGLGYDVRPVIIDRGDDDLFDSKKIAEAIKARGFGADILKLRDTAYLSEICLFAAKEIKNHLKKFDNLGENESHCTPCYNARTIALTEYSLRLGSPAFVIGQHRNDMITSLMKCYWTEQYYYTFTKPEGIPYDGHRMREFIGNREIDFDYLESMVVEGRAATDDPPVEIIKENVRLVRPLEAVSEREIREFIGEYPHTSGNCTYRQREPRPFRLLVQFDLEERIGLNPGVEDLLYELVMKGLNEDGTLKFRPRNLRDKLYHGFKPFIKKI